MKYETVKSIILIMLVAVSIFLTWNIWTYQPKYDTIDSADAYDISISEKKEPKSLIKPFKFFYHEGDKVWGTTNEIEINTLLDEMMKWNISELNNITNSVSDKTLDEIVHGDRRLEIIFPDIVPFQEYSNVLNFEDKNLPSNSFNRIIVDTSDSNDDTNIVYFVKYGENEKAVFEGKINSNYLPLLEKEVIREIPYNYASYFTSKFNKKTLHLPVEKPEKISYQYYTKEFSTEDFKLALFSDPTSVKKDYSSTGEEFTDWTSIMRVDTENNTLEYVNPAEEPTGSSDLNQLVERSIEYVNDHGGWTDNYQFFSASTSENKIDYRLFLQGLPVFDDQDMSVITQVWGRDSINRYGRPYFSLKLSIPSYIKKVKVPSGSELLTILERAENAEMLERQYIEDVAIGYKLKKEPNWSQLKIISLEPSWYYKLSESWIRLPSMEEIKEVENGLE
jgi:regulatory protein YycH of two-component signal transduction system YycFG